MNNLRKPSHSTRRYPKFWDKAVPIFLVILGLAVLILLIIIFTVIAGQTGGI